MEKKSDSFLLSFCLLLTGLCVFHAAIIRQFISYPYLLLNWAEARHHCRSHHVDLITLNSKSDLNVLQDLVKGEGGAFWIGLFRDPNNDRVWTWISV